MYFGQKLLKLKKHMIQAIKRKKRKKKKKLKLIQITEEELLD